MKASPILGLYVITSAGIETDKLLSDIACAIQGGATVIQYRSKDSDDAVRIERAKMLQKLCRSHGIPLIINDDIDLARRIGADGVHLGRNDYTVQQARSMLGTDTIIGASCYNSLEFAHEAEKAGTDYVAFGSFYPSRTKPDTVRATPALLQQARNTLNIPIVAIGGITPLNGAALIRAGADALAVISGLYSQDDIEQTVRRYTKLFRNMENTVTI